MFVIPKHKIMTEEKQIGKTIKEAVDKKNMTVVFFAKEIGRSENWCFKLFADSFVPKYPEQVKIETLLNIKIWNL